MATIQWFPGHMTRAKRQIQEKLKLIDLAIELLDARVPLSSRNPMIDEILMNKPRLVLLNKADLADPSVTREWVQYFAGIGIEALPIDCVSGEGVRAIPERAKHALKDKIEKQLSKGMNPRAVRALIVGIPNVGKSTLINRLAGKHIAATGDKPGVTKGQQWIKAGGDLELLDTPGILWPKFEDQQVGYKLAAIGSISDQILQVEDVAYHAIRFLIAGYPGELQQRYELDELPSGQSEPNAFVDVMERIGRKRGCLQSGGTINLEKASMVILRDLRGGKLGRISLESPNQMQYMTSTLDG
ncbi:MULTISPECIES: ribosome biogenesis GTPase YlqF [Paenibacillus]|uniref:Ribosome biogenesis GTPase A n=1 Tax=Paenibacillus oceani TaxID=2772510 RepID=A0A927CAJ7_9BACL|nr:ribosome biogenesis GTPase YlqF [Paenibacillus oceani]MBD2862731.1 ribosome biogenesis GTPase YlqF [Paenibacillus oceani]MDF2657415.1 GTPase [Paenibacillus sp.]